MESCMLELARWYTTPGRPTPTLDELRAQVTLSAPYWSRGGWCSPEEIEAGVARVVELAAVGFERLTRGGLFV